MYIMWKREDKYYILQTVLLIFNYICKKIIMEKIGVIPNVEGVYCIQNKVNNKIYIGSSKNLQRRFYQHKAGPKKK